MVSLQVNLDDDQVARLAERARPLGVAPEELARRLLAEQLTDRGGGSAGEVDPFAWIGSGASDEAQSDRVDELLAEEVRPIALLIDTGPLFAAANRRDRHHEVCAHVLRFASPPLRPSSPRWCWPRPATSLAPSSVPGPRPTSSPPCAVLATASSR